MSASNNSAVASREPTGSILECTHCKERKENQAKRNGKRYSDRDTHADASPLCALLDPSSDGRHHPWRLGQIGVVNIRAAEGIRVKRKSLVVQIANQAGENFSVLQFAMNKLVLVAGKRFGGNPVLIRGRARLDPFALPGQENGRRRIWNRGMLKQIFTRRGRHILQNRRINLRQRSARLAARKSSRQQGRKKQRESCDDFHRTLLTSSSRLGAMHGLGQNPCRRIRTPRPP